MYTHMESMPLPKALPFVSVATTSKAAGIACYLSDIRLQQDAWDIWDNHAPIVGVKNGNIIGYKYFGFGGLKKDQLGLKAFEGTK